jgi:hypothetical protein
VAVSASTAIREWINARPGLTGKGNPLPLGAHLDGEAVRSPAHGAYALLIRDPGVNQSAIAEDYGVSLARITAHVKAGTIQAAEAACVALSNAFQSLTGCPEPCGTTGVMVLVADNFAEPGYVPVPGTGGEQFEFTCGAVFMLAPR